MYNYQGQGQGLPLQQQQTGFYQQVPPQQQFQQDYGQQQLGMQPQATGYMQPQATGYVQSQQTGFMQPQSTGYIQPQVTGYLQQQATSYAPPPVPSIPQQYQQQPASSTTVATSTTELHIPNVRLSFITAADQRNFETLFRSRVVASEQSISGDAARDILMLSGLTPTVLSDIWMLSDTTKSGKLLFPEFALAMYLCSLVIKGQSLPTTLPENIKNEVTSLVDIISFKTPDQNPPNLPSNVPSFNNPSTQPTPSAQNTNESSLNSLISLQQTVTGNQGLQSQLTGYTPTIQAQTTGYTPTLQAQTTGYTPTLQAQTTGYTPTLQAQTTGYTPTIQAQTTGYQPVLTAQGTGYQPALIAQGTGYQPALTAQGTGYQPALTAQGTGYQVAPLTAMPTGRPGEWGFINAPVGGLPGMDVFKSRFMPQQGVQNFTSSELQGNAKVEWAITKDEKRIYDSIFSEWDKEHKGFITGEMGIQIFGQSGLNRQDLETIWTLADPGNKGKLDRDEFAVAMHLIYRHLNGYPIPSRLPPELIPPSSVNFSDSVDKMKSFLKTGSNKSSSGPVSYLKEHSLKSSAPSFKKDATTYKNNDDEFTYKSKSRHRARKEDKERDQDEYSDKMSISQLKKLVHERKIILDAIDAKDEDDYDAVQDMEYRDLKVIDELKGRITNIQKEINAHPDAPLLASDPNEKKKELLRQLNKDADALPQITNEVRKVEDEIASLKMELFRLQSESQNPGSTIVGTGPNGTITESDRRKARARAKLKARMAAITGDNSAVSGGNEFEDYEAKLYQESEAVRKERENHENLFRDIEESADQIKRDLEISLRESRDDISTDRDRLRWEEAIGVEDDVKDLIYSLRHMANSNKGFSNPYNSSSSSSQPASYSTPTLASSKSAPAPVPANSSKRSASERAAYIKAEAERRMNEKMAALGITRPTKSSSAFSAPTGNSSESNAASPASSTTSLKKTPPPPPPHHKKPGISSPATSSPAPVSSAPTPAPAAFQTPTPSVPKASPAPISAPTPSAEDESSSSDDDDDEFMELQRLKKQEEERIRKLEEEKKAKDAKKAAKAQKKAERLAALKAEMDAMKERERKLMVEDHSDPEPEAEIAVPTPVVATFSPTVKSTATPSAASDTHSSNPFQRNTTAASTPSPAHHESNPFLKNQQQQQPATSSVPAAPTPTVASAPAPDASVPASTPAAPFRPTTPRAPEKGIDPSIAASQRASQRGQNSYDDGWGADSSSSDEEDEDSPRGGPDPSALASMLFSRMAPQRPLGAQQTGGTPSQQPAATSSPAVPVPEAKAEPATTSAPAIPPVPPAQPVETPSAVPQSLPVPETLVAASQPPPIPNFFPEPESVVPPPPASEAPSFPSISPPPPPPVPDFGAAPLVPTSIAPPPPPPVPDFGAPPPPPVPDFGAPPPPPVPDFGAPPPPPVPDFGAAPAVPGVAVPPVPNFGVPPPPPPPMLTAIPGGAPPPPPPPPPTLPSAEDDSRPDFAGSGLLLQIQQGAKLKSVKPPR